MLKSFQPKTHPEMVAPMPKLNLELYASNCKMVHLFYLWSCGLVVDT